MPRIDPLSLLKCLSVLLGPTGGIKSKEEVQRLANLMTKFSKKLVSKCIYIQILKTTNTDLLSQFMGAGGWNLIHMWLTDGILAKNWALIQELLELLLLCPVDIERLKSNNCPKLIKGLSKEGSHQGVRILASRLVEQWLKIVKGEAAPNSVPAQIMSIPIQGNAALGQSLLVQSNQQQLQQDQYILNCGIQQSDDNAEPVTVQVQDLQYTQASTTGLAVGQVQQQEQQQLLQEKLQVQPVHLQIISKPQQVQLQQQSGQQKKQSFVVVSTSSQATVPVYKITIRDGKQVLAKVETDAANINSVLNVNANADVNGDVANDAFLVENNGDASKVAQGTVSDEVTSELTGITNDTRTEQSDRVSSEVKQAIISSKDNSSNDVTDVQSKDNKDAKESVSSDSSKSSDKENRDSHKKDDKKSSSSSDKKSSSHHSSSSSSKSSSKHSSSSSSHRSGSTSSHKSSSSSSHRSGSSSSSKSSSSKDKSSRDKDKHSGKHSSSRSRSEREREREKEKQKKDQAEKDKATLEKIQGQTLSSKLGKIPKKKTDEDRKSSDSREASKDKVDSKKPSGGPVPEKKNISISIENRKNSQDSTSRPKTVKTFNSKFRSTGLEEEAKPPPPRSVKKPNPIVDKKMVPPKVPAQKRPSPVRDTSQPADKRAKLSLDSPTTPPAEEKKGGIKLIPPKPKPMVLQESDMFMDALTASTKSKEPRKRKRRTSISKDGPSDAKKQEVGNTDSHESTPPPTSPPSADEKSPVVIKPNFKFYQDTLETEEDKEQKEKEKGQEDGKRDKDDEDIQKENRDGNDDDAGSNTPTPDDDVEDTKTSESPEESNSEGSDQKKDTSPFPEIRYVDGLKSVLLLQKRRGPKKSLKWKTDLESIRYFELDETERVNVTKTFTDMKQMEKQNEREAFLIARKLSNEDLMEERTRWKPLIPIDLPPPLVEPGKDSREKDIQYAREKGILQALYFNRSMIPDSAAEPDEERHHVMTDPKVIPLDDLTGNKESEKDFTSVPWPEPKPQTVPQPQPMTNFHYQPFPHGQQPIMTPMGPQAGMAMPQMTQQMMPPTHMGQMPAPDMSGGPMIPGGGGWRTGDGKVVMPDVTMNPMGNMPGAFPQGMEGAPPGMVPPGMMGPPMYNQQQDGYGMMAPEDMGFNPNMNPNNFQGPPGPMFGPGPNFQGPRGGGPMRGRGGPGPGGWYRGGGGPPVRGGWRGGGGGWRGNGKQPPVCRQFSKNGYCRVGDKCQYLHPGINCPPF